MLTAECSKRCWSVTDPGHCQPLLLRSKGPFGSSPLVWLTLQGEQLLCPPHCFDGFLPLTSFCIPACLTLISGCLLLNMVVLFTPTTLSLASLAGSVWIYFSTSTDSVLIYFSASTGSVLIHFSASAGLTLPSPLISLWNRSQRIFLFCCPSWLSLHRTTLCFCSLVTLLNFPISSTTVWEAPHFRLYVSLAYSLFPEHGHVLIAW